MGWLDKYQDGGIIKDDRGQWNYPGEITEIGSNQITMQGVPYPVLGVSDTGDTQMMFPNQDYKFKGKKVTEFPMAQDGRIVSPMAGFLKENINKPKKSFKEVANENNIVQKDNTYVAPKQKEAVLKKEVKIANNNINQINDVRQYLESYIQSPKYKERLLKSGYGQEETLSQYYTDPTNILYKKDYISPIDEEIKNRLKELQKTDVRFDYKNDRFADIGSSYAIKDSIKLRPLADNYISTVNEQKTYPREIEKTIAHEMSHRIQFGSNRKLVSNELEYMYGLNKKESKMLIENNIGLYRVKNRDEIISMKNNPENYDLEHDMKPGEMKADLDALRYQLWKEKVYDARTEDFNLEHLNKVKKSFVKDRLQKQYTDEALIKLMNTIAEQKKENKVSEYPIAQNGKKLINFTQSKGWLSKYE
tara:strand:- start:31036 stop:32292 length:1257 start_codon:yes stop_codon:yes gene_type:complete